MSGEAPVAGPGGEERSWDVSWTWVDVALAFAIGLVLAQLLQQILAAVLPAGVHESVVPIAGGAGLIVGVVGWVRLRHPGTVRRLLGPGPLRLPAALAAAGHGAVAFVVLNFGFATLFALVLDMVGVELPPVQESLRERITDPDLAVGGLVYTLSVAVVAEELLYRGLAYPALRRPLGPWPAIAATGLLFGVVHQQPDLLASFYTITVMTLFGCHLAWVFERYRHLVPVLIMHGVFNGLAVVAILRAWG